MSTESWGHLFALLTALSWALSVILLKLAGTEIAPAPLNLFKNVVGLALVLATSRIWGNTAPQPSGHDVAWLIGSGAVGVGLADTLVLHALRLTGASLQAIVEAIYAPAVVVFSYWLLGEVLSPLHAVGGALILLAVLLASREGANALALERRVLLEGILSGGTAMGLMALAIVLIKPILEQGDVLICTAWRLVGGIGALVAGMGMRGQLGALLHAAFAPQRAWRTAIPGAVLGSYLALVLWIAAFKYAAASSVALLNQTSTVFVVLLAAPILKEPLTVGLGIALALSALGCVFVLL